MAEAGTVRQSAIGVGFGLFTTGSLLQEGAASEHRVGGGTHDVNKGSRVHGVSVVIFPSVAHPLYPFDASETDEIVGRMNALVSSDAATAKRSVDPAWRV